MLLKVCFYFTFYTKGEIRNHGRYPAGFYQDKGNHDQGDRSREQLLRPAFSCGPQLVGCHNPRISTDALEDILLIFSPHVPTPTLGDLTTDNSISSLHSYPTAHSSQRHPSSRYW